jgi:hypothetical protein
VDLLLCDDIDLGGKFASECIYVAGDPINLRDPWGLAAQEQGVRAGGSHPCPTAQNPAQTCWDEEEDEDEADPGGGGGGGGGGGYNPGPICDWECERRQDELLERAQRKAAEKAYLAANSGGASGGPGTVAISAEGKPGFFERLFNLFREKKAGAGGAVKDGTVTIIEGQLHRLPPGASRAPFTHVDAIGDAAGGAAELGIEAIAGGPLLRMAGLGLIRFGGGAAATTANISAEAAARISAFAKKYNVTVHVVGSRARGTAHALSDYDYVITGASGKVTHQAKRFLPRGLGGGEINAAGRETGIDIYTGALDDAAAHVTFLP